MAAWKEKTKTQTVANLRHTVDFGYYTSNMVGFILLTAFCCGIMYLPLGSRPEFWGIVGIYSACLLVPYGIFYVIQMIRVFRKADHYIFCQAMLCQPHNHQWTRNVYFTVMLEDLEGGKFVVDTKAMFRPTAFFPPRMEDYVNKTVTVGYNEETGAVVVID